MVFRRWITWKKLLSNDEKDDLFDEIRICEKKLINIVIPNSRLSWSNIEHIAGVFLKGKTFEVLKLKGQLSHNWEPNKDKHGIWIKQKGDLVFIEHNFLTITVDLIIGWFSRKEVKINQENILSSIVLIAELI